ncbi:type I restriction endonuclease subunit R [Phocaeicola coprophilus]|uniref:type I restriction endonuclease subunit R n=1 Tax=Phocaeicola coprophilus TaxID=387090 RepID=UPI002658D5C2|nr:type I restriction endonuclease subunit R [Phocaeicola coprophilus]
MSEQYKMVAENPQSTVVSDYEPRYRTAKQYQSEAEMEKEFIEQLQTQAYDYLSITSEKELIENLRHQLEKLNGYRFTDKEWTTFFKEKIANQNSGIVEKTAIVQDDYIQLLTREDGSTKNIYLLDKKDIHNNYLQVINQYVPEGGSHENRYDVTILVNGLPLVHVELKRRGVDIKEAFNQIRRYNRESFWAGCGLFEYVQIFVISNGTQTKYYSNTTRVSHIAEQQKKKQSKSKNQTSNSFEFTSYWARRDNQIIPDLVDFTATFFAKHTLLNILTKYCVFTSEKLLLVMRPYQIAATESILQQIRVSTNYKKYGTVEGGGFVWHTTGSGKTLTSFKTARLASKMEGIDKVLFVVDRKDLDYQTMKEYDRFEKGAANSNTNTAVLKKQLENDDAHIIITTIQKLSIFISQNRSHKVYGKHIVMIFDECHRSQFGEMHTAIVKKFKKYHLFGFTGTPIFPNNSSTGGKFDLKTTDQTFGKRLHIYTIVDAIADGNVLPFRVDYISTMREQEDIRDEQVRNIDREKALMAPERISHIVAYILEHFAQKTKRNGKSFTFNKLTNISEVAEGGKKGKCEVKEQKQKVRMQGFNSIFAVSSIEAAKLYYLEFKRQMEELSPDRKLNVAIIYSYGANEAEEDFSGIPDDENSDNTDGLDKSSRDFLESAIVDYNKIFATNYDTSSEKFQNYYKDVSLRMKNREIDLLIVVNMFLTGFDATTLNTLWVDKNLRMHGLLQAYSRTNRILNSIKTFGNIVCFRNLEHATNESIALFGDKEAGGLVLLKTFDEYYNGYEDENGKHQPGYMELVNTLLEDYPLETRIMGEDSEKKFIRLYGAILKATNILSTFDQFAGMEILSERDVQDYHSLYIDLYEKYRRNRQGDVVDVNDDIIFEMELIKQVEINIDYILYLIEQMHDGNTGDKEIRITIRKAIGASPDLRNKRELIENFIDQLTPDKNVSDDWQKYVKEQQRRQLDEIISEEKLKPEETYHFVNQSFKDGGIQESGTGIAKILPPMSIFDKTREMKKKTVLEKLKAFFERFFDISGGDL